MAGTRLRQGVARDNCCASRIQNRYEADQTKRNVRGSRASRQTSRRYRSKAQIARQRGLNISQQFSRQRDDATEAVIAKTFEYFSIFPSERSSSHRAFTSVMKQRRMDVQFGVLRGEAWFAADNWRPYAVDVPVLRRFDTAVTSCAGANGFSIRMLLGTPCDAH
jgi:hypothetical protein